MSPKYVLHTPSPANPHENQPTSTFMPPIFIEMGDEGGEFLEAKIKDKVCPHPFLPSVSVNPLPLDRRDRPSRRRLDPPIWHPLHRHLGRWWIYVPNRCGK